MASKSEALSTKQVEELLDAVDLTMERLKTLYEQYFLGIQKQAPSFIHNDVERKLRDLTQMNVRNTGLRYRLATLTQKFGSYNSYWRRTLRQIENGTYIRNLAKIGREAIAKGSDIPEEILAAMPKRMRDQVIRDRDNALAIAKRRNQVDEGAITDDASHPPEPDDVAAMISEPSVVRHEVKTQSGAHLLSEDDGDLDFDQLFAAFQDDAPPSPPPKQVPRPVPEHARIEPAQTQKITMPVPRFNKPGTATASDDAKTAPIPRIPMAPHATDVTGPPPIVTPPTETSVLPRFTSPTTSPADEARTIALPKFAPPVAPSQQIRPNPIAPGSAAATGPVQVESMSGPFPREKSAAPGATVPRAPTPSPGARLPTPSVGTPPPRAPTPAPGARLPTPSAGTPPPRPGAPPGTRPPPPAAGTAPRPPQRMPTPPPGPQKPPPGMTEADVNALHAKYVQAKQMVGEKVDPSSREKLLRTINQTAPRVMEQYKSAGVDFTVVVKDNQVVIKAKPKG